MKNSETSNNTAALLIRSPHAQNYLLIGINGSSNDFPVDEFVNQYPYFDEKTKGIFCSTTCDFVEFIPSSSSEEFQTWSTSDEEKKVREMSMGKLLTYLQEKESNNLNQVWEDSKLGFAVYTVGLMFGLNGQDCPSDSTPVSLSLSVPDNVVANLELIARAHFDVDDVYVSNQIVPANKFFTDFSEFQTQAEDRLIEGVHYRKSMYDTQFFPSGEPFVPLFVIPISILKKLDRIVDMNEHKDFMDRFKKEFAGRELLASLLSEIDENATILSNVFLSHSEILNMWTDYYGSFELAREKAFPAPKMSMWRSAFSRLFHR